MPKKVAEMSAQEVRNLTSPGTYRVGGVPGLCLQVLPTGTQTWVLRAKVGNRRRELGLGGYPGVTLALAREKARQARDKIRAGVDPIEQAREARSALRASQAGAITFKEAADSYLKANEAGWRSTKHATQWRTTLETYAFPQFGEMLVRDVALPHVMAVLEPIWTKKTETASRVRNRIELVLDWAAARGYRDALNPARWRGHLDKLLPKPTKVARVRNHPALPVADMGAFMKRLRAMEGFGARALEFAVLTAARSGEVRGATWPEIDLDGAVWRVPGERTKAGREHRVPLSPAAVKLLRALPRIVGTDYVFPATRGGALSDMALLAVTRRMEINAVPHGFRSSFRDWAAERTNYPNEVVEMALAHAIGDKTEAAYRRGDLFEKRRRLMNEWAAFCAKVEGKADVVPIGTAHKGKTVA